MTPPVRSQLARLVMTVLLLSGSLGPAQAAPARDPEAILLALKAAHPGTQFSAVHPTPMPGIHEVVMGENVAYIAGGNTRYMLFGRLWDARDGLDLTAARMSARAGAAVQAGPARSLEDLPKATLALKDAPLADALKTVNGNGARKLVVFSDPGCHHCRRLDQTLAGMNDITIYIFLVPFRDRAAGRAIWCAADRNAAWRAAIAGTPTAVDASEQCQDPIARNFALAAKLRLRGTPTIFFADGARVDGDIDAEQIEQRFSNEQSTVHP